MEKPASQDWANQGTNSFTKFADVAAIGSHFNKLKGTKHRKRMGGKRGIGSFERRYSKLALSKQLVAECRKRIDFVLIYPNVCSKDTKDEEKKAQLQRHEKNRERLMTLLEREGFSIQKDIIGEKVYVKLHCPFKRLCVEAERVNLEMPLKDMDIPEPKPMNFIQRFADKHLETDNDVDDYMSTAFVMNKIYLFEGYEDPANFFRPALRSYLVYHILINLDIRTAKELEEDLADSDDDNEEDTTCSCCPSICKTVFSCCTHKEKADAIEQQQKISLKRRGLPFLLMKGTYTDTLVLHDDSNRSRRKEDKISDHFICNERELPVLLKDPRKDLDEKWTSFTKFQPLWHIRDYFGEKIAMYFAWIGMLIATLWIPSIFGIIIFFYGLSQSLTEDSTTTTNSTEEESLQNLLGDVKRAFDNDVTPYFALFICCWGTVFLELWKRQLATLAYEWDVDQFEANEPDRPQFYGTTVKPDPVTRQDSWFYPFRKQILKLITSTSVVIFMVCLVAISVFSVIIYRVIMNVDYCPDMTEQNCFIVTTLASSVFNACSILILGKIYDKLAVVLTDWENHRTQTRYDDALIFKLFAFQFVNSYASCFYIAFIRGRGSLFEDRYVDSCEGSCMTQLSFQVLTLMVIKPLPKLFKDIFLPYLIKYWRRRPNCLRCRCLPCCRPNQVQGEKTNLDDGLQHSSQLGFLEREQRKPELGDFTLGEFTEKVILYGFLMLFAASLPVAPILALGFSYIDIRIDAKRLLWMYRRPVAFISQDIGMWQDILTLLNLIGVITNAFILAFTSNWGKDFSTAGKLWIVVGFEHIVFSLKFILAYMIPDVPQSVNLAIRQEKFLVMKKFEDDSPPGQTDYTSLFSPELMKGRIDEEDEDDAEAGSVQLSRNSQDISSSHA